MIAVVVHNSDEVKDVFIGESKDEVLNKLKASVYWENIKERLEEEFLENEEVEFGEEEVEFDERNVTLDKITELYHDGDSEDGFTEVKPK